MSAPFFSVSVSERECARNFSPLSGDWWLQRSSERSIDGLEQWESSSPSPTPLSLSLSLSGVVQNQSSSSNFAVRGVDGCRGVCLCALLRHSTSKRTIVFWLFVRSREKERERERLMCISSFPLSTVLLFLLCPHMDDHRYISRKNGAGAIFPSPFPSLLRLLLILVLHSHGHFQYHIPCGGAAGERKVSLLYWSMPQSLSYRLSEGEERTRERLCRVKAKRQKDPKKPPLHGN